MTSKMEHNLELVNLLRKGHMYDQPGARLLIKRAQATGDFDPLMDYLNRFPMILANAKRNILVARMRELSIPFKLPLPWEFEDHLNGPIRLGFLDENQRFFFGLSFDDINKHLAEAGATGRGKTELLRRLAYSLVTQRLDPVSDIQVRVIIIDPAKAEYRGLLHHFPSAKFITKEQLRLNPLEVYDFLTPSEHRVMVSDVMCRTLMGYVLTRSRLITSQEILLKNQPQANLRDLRNLIQAWQKQTRTYGMADTLARIVARLDLLLESEIFDCVRGIPFSTFTDHELLVLELDGLDPKVQAMITAFIISSLYHHNRKTDRGVGRLHVFICEEARELMNHPNRDEWDDSAWDQNIARVRAANIAMVSATQEPATLSDTTASNCFLKIAFGAQSGQDFETVKTGWSLNDEQAKYISKLEIGQAVVRYGRHPDPFLIRVPLLEMPDFITDDDLAAQMSPYWSELQQQVVYRRAPETVTKKQPPEFEPDAGYVLKLLSAQPFLSRTELQQSVKGFLSRESLDAALAWLRDKQFITARKISLHGRRPGTFYEIQSNAYEFGIQPPKGSGSFRHRCFQHYLKLWAGERGAQARIEGIPDTRIGKRVDVLVTEPDGQLVAQEVTLSLDNVVKNCVDDFRSGVGRVVVVCPDAPTRDRAMYLVENSQGLALLRDAIDFRLIWEMEPKGE